MNINRKLAHSIKHTTNKDIVLGSIAGISVILTSLDFILLKNNLYELIFLAQLIFVNFMLVFTYIGEYRNMKNYQYVHNMGFLIKELSRENLAGLELEDLIRIQTRHPVSNLWMTKIRIAFHNFCCESLYILVFCCSTLVIIQFFMYGDKPHLILGQVIILSIITFFDTMFLVIGLVIEFPRRIRLYFRLRKLHFNYEAEFNRDSLRQQDREEDHFQIIQNHQINQSEIPQQQIRNSIEIQQQDLQQGRRNQQPRSQSTKSDQFVSFQEIFIENSLRKSLVDKNLMSVTSKKDDEIECPFCCLAIEETHQKTQLKCHYSHIYHTKCLEAYINNCLDKSLPATCMICRKELS